jgi:glutathione synthase/RimK-type ligase-like ATP-grasp enzyme
LYASLPPQALPQRHLRIALVATKPARTSNIRLRDEAIARGHMLDILPLDTLSIAFDSGKPRLRAGGTPVMPYDAVIARATGGAPGLAAAVLHYMQAAGAVPLNAADAIERLRNPYLLANRLNGHGLPAEVPAGDGAACRILLVLGAPVATQGAASVAAQQFAIRIGAALDLGMVAIDVEVADGHPRLVGIDPNPPLTGYSQAAALARAIITALETRVRTPAILPATADGDS